MAAFPAFPWNPPAPILSAHISSDSLTFFAPQPRTRFTKTCQTLKTSRFSCCRTSHPRPAKLDHEAPRKPRKPRPSFSEQIRHKWSSKIWSPRGKLPWQVEIQEAWQEPDETEPARPSGIALVSEPDTNDRSRPNLDVENPFVSGSWARGGQSREPSFNSGSEIPSDSLGKGETTDWIRRYSKRIDRVSVVERSKNTEKEVRDSSGVNKGDGWKRKSHTKVADTTIPEHELQRLRRVSLRMLERIKVGAAGITQALVDSIHDKWKVDEVVKLKFEGPLLVNMKRIHEALESKTGGLVIWRSGSSIVLYRGMAYKLHCVQQYSKKSQPYLETSVPSKDSGSDATWRKDVEDPVGTTGSLVSGFVERRRELSERELADMFEFNQLLDPLGPRFKDWLGRDAVPIDADLLPPVVPGYQTPFRLLPYGIKHGLLDSQMTKFRRLARRTPPHFVLGRNRQLQGLAGAMVKLWEKSDIAKIAIKGGVQNTCNERMAEEIRKLTGGILLSRNKEYIVFYRGNDFLPTHVAESLIERQKLRDIQQDKEEQARKKTSALVVSNAKSSKDHFVAGTLAETRAAASQWGTQPSHRDIWEMKRESALARHALLIEHLEKKLAIAKGKVKQAEKALAKVQKDLKPAGLPMDLETITDEERFLFRKIGLSMKPYLLLGRRDVFDGVIQNMHLHWKYREVVKIIVKRKTPAQIKHIAISLEAESGGVLVSLDNTTKGTAIIFYRGKNYQWPSDMRPTNLLTKRQALARSVELQRREALKHHILELQENIKLLKRELEETPRVKEIDEETFHSKMNYDGAGGERLEGCSSAAGVIIM